MHIGIYSNGRVEEEKVETACDIVAYVSVPATLEVNLKVGIELASVMAVIEADGDADEYSVGVYADCITLETS